MNKDDYSEVESENRILGPPDVREQNRIKPNPTVRIQPVFVTTGPGRDPVKGKQNTRVSKGLCLEISGRVQHDGNELHHFVANGQRIANASFEDGLSQATSYGDEPECSLDYN